MRRKMKRKLRQIKVLIGALKLYNRKSRPFVGWVGLCSCIEYTLRHMPIEHRKCISFYKFNRPSLKENVPILCRVTGIWRPNPGMYWWSLDRAMIRRLFMVGLMLCVLFKSKNFLSYEYD